MNATWSITAFVVIDDLMTALKHKSHPLAQASDAEVLTVAIVAATYFQNHHERALCVMRECNYFSGHDPHPQKLIAAAASPGQDGCTSSRSKGALPVQRPSPPPSFLFAVVRSWRVGQVGANNSLIP